MLVRGNRWLVEYGDEKSLRRYCVATERNGALGPTELLDFKRLNINLQGCQDLLAMDSDKQC